MINTRDHKGRGRALARLALAGVLAMPLAACDTDEILNVPDPDVIREADLEQETAIPAIRASAIASFKDAFTGSDGQILYAGLLADEWIHSGTFPTRKEVDTRSIQFDNATLQDVTRELYRARRAAETAAERLAALNAEPTAVAEALNLAGTTYVLFAENYCSGVPFSELQGGDEFVFGDPETTSQVLQRALDRFNSALAVGDISENQRSFAQVGIGRALLDMGRFQEAAAAVSEVQTNFLYVLDHSANSAAEYNNVFTMNILSERWSMANNEGINGLPYRDAFLEGDPRLPWRRIGKDVGFDRRTPQFDQLLYNDYGSKAVVASGVEARLIEAEAVLQSGNFERMVEILNELREEAAALLALRDPTFPVIVPDAELDPITDVPETRLEALALLYKERAYWLFLTSHRLGDLRRLLNVYGLPESELYPEGPYFKTGEPYGDAVSLPLPVDEENNPNFLQCDNTAAGEEEFPIP